MTSDAVTVGENESTRLVEYVLEYSGGDEYSDESGAFIDVFAPGSFTSSVGS
jgi:hypothetical protein